MGDYRNDGRFIYNGRMIEDLDYTEDIDGYGFLPVEYSLEEFIDPSRWCLEHQIDHNSIVWADFTNPVYQTVDKTDAYVIFRRDNVYYTVVPHEDNVGFLQLSQMTLDNRVYYFDVNNDRLTDPMYEPIRDKVRGYVLIMQT
jgi:hypothetical protein